MNPASWIILALVIAVLVFVIVKMIKDRKAGKTSCGCGCENCALHGKCHKL